MDRGEKLRVGCERIDLRRRESVWSSKYTPATVGDWVIRSGLTFPRVPTSLDVAGMPHAPTGRVTDYHEGAEREMQKWLRTCD